MLICGIATAAAATSLVGLLFRGNIRLRIMIILLSLSAGCLWSCAYAAIYSAPASNVDTDSGRLTAIVGDLPSPTARGYRIDARIRPPTGPQIGARLYYNHETNLKPGDIIEFTAQFRRTDGTGEIERIDDLIARGTYLIGYISGDISVVGSENGLKYVPKRLAGAVASMIDRLYGEDTAPFMKALLVGERGDLSAQTELTTALSASGISHVVAISGMHVSFLMSFLAAFVKNKRLFAFVGIPVLVMFMAMTGFTPSISRAGIMQLFLICAPIFKRESDSLTSLGAALILLLAANPFSCVSVGFQLSFAATLGIILFSSRIDAAVTDGLHESNRIKSKAAKSVMMFISKSLATTIGALIFTLPLTGIHFGTVSLIAPLTNLLTLWAVSVTFMSGLVSCVLGFLFLPLGSVVAVAPTFGVRYIIYVARLMAAIPYSTVYSSNAFIVCWLAYIYILFITLPLMKARLKQYILPCCFAVILLCAILLVSPLVPGMGAGTLTVLDVGQGLSTVIAANDNTIVIDCGSSSGEDAGMIAHEFLSNSGRTSISMLILTHFHADHANGVEYLLSRMSVSALMIPDPEDSFLAEDIISLARQRGTDIIYVTETLGVSLGNLDIIIYPPLGFGDENERGLSILCMGDVSALITGDMPASGERTLLRFAELPKIDVLVVGHHGSRFSTSDELLDAVSPRIAVISSGYNTYGHPSPDTIRRLERFSVVIYRTDQMGHVSIGG